MVLFDVMLSQANVLISDTGAALLADFGFSHIVNSSFGITVPDHRGLKGTAHWMAPEMFEGENVSAEADVWAFGMTVLVCSFPIDVCEAKQIHTGAVHLQRPFLLHSFTLCPHCRYCKRKSPGPAK